MQLFNNLIRNIKDTPYKYYTNRRMSVSNMQEGTCGGRVGDVQEDVRGDGRGNLRGDMQGEARAAKHYAPIPICH